MAIVEKVSVQRFCGRRHLSICDISRRDATLVDRRMPWQLSEIGNVLDYHPVENCRVFVARASPTVETDEIAPNHSTSTDPFSAAVHKRAHFCETTDGLLFSFAYLL